ncbi:type I restriction enzyme S subunit [Pedobacter sp. UYP24]
MRDNWETKKFGEVIEIRNGKNQQAVLSNTGKYKIMGSAGNAMGYATDFICEAGTTIIGRKGNISKPIYIDERIWNVDTAFGFFPKNEDQIDKRLIYYLCLGIDFKSMNRGTTIPSLVKSELQTIQINYPKSLIEQQRIIAILDNTFATIARAIANAEQNLKNAKKLFENYLQGVFENKGDHWEEKTLVEIALDFGRGKSKHRPRNWKGLYEGDFPFIQTGDVRNANKFVTEYSQTYNEVGLAQSKLWKKGTICITIAANIAETAILDFDSCFPDSIIGLEVDPSKADLDFVYYTLQYLKSELKKLGKGSAQDNINLGTFENYKLPFPISIDEQQAIVQKLDALSTETKKLKSTYQQKLDRFEELKKSILHKAFSGTLKAKKMEIYE